jgi:hypothetical protein
MSRISISTLSARPLLERRQRLPASFMTRKRHAERLLRRVSGCTRSWLIRTAPAFFAHTELGDASVLANGAAMRRAGNDPGDVWFHPKMIADFIAIDDAMAATIGASGNVRLYRDRPDVVMQHTTAQQTGTRKRSFTRYSTSVQRHDGDG